MSRMVVQVFELRRDAEKARERLVLEGFDRACIHVDSEAGSEAAPVEEPRRSREPFWAHTEKHGLSGVIERMFSGLLNDDDDYVRYTQALRTGKSVVAIHVPDHPSARRAAWIMDEVRRDSSMSVSEEARSSTGVPFSPQIYPLPNAPTGWNQATEGEQSTIAILGDPLWPEGFARDAHGLGSDDTVMADRKTASDNNDNVRK